VVVRLAGCGVCASSLPLFEGREWFTYPRPPGEPGHEGWGIVETLGDGVTSLVPGLPVALFSQRAFAEADVAPADAVLPLPAPLARETLPLEPLACAMNAFRRAGVRRGHTVAIVGVGFLGALLVQLARWSGAHVVALSRRPFAQRLAERLGAHLVLPTDDRFAAADAVRKWASADGCDRVIECVGLQEALDLASDLVATRGRLVIAGYHQDGPRRVDLQSWNWRGIDVVNAHERDQAEYVRGGREALAALADGRLRLDELITHRFPLARLGDALEAARERPEGFLKAVVEV
jgi:threonine dehydrogenase-like Zn-dependent dehydrogenase